MSKSMTAMSQTTRDRTAARLPRFTADAALRAHARPAAGRAAGDTGATADRDAVVPQGCCVHVPLVGCVLESPFC